MRVLIGGVSSEKQYVSALQSFEQVKKRAGDEVRMEYRHRGDTNRILILNYFFQHTEYDAVWMVDMDMIFKPNVLERLRSYNVDMVTGMYYRRGLWPMKPIVTISPNGTWPYFVPYDIPEDGLHDNINGWPIVHTGFGNVLIKRCVLNDVKKDLPLGASPFALGGMPEMTGGEHGPWGADYRFFTLARQAGYTLHLDANEECEAKHGTTIFLDRKVYNIFRPHQYDLEVKGWTDTGMANRRLFGMDLKSATARLKKLEETEKKLEEQIAFHKAKLEQLINTQAVVYGQKYERNIDINTEKNIRLPVAGEEELEQALEHRKTGDLPGLTAKDIAANRERVYEREAKEIVEALDARPKDTEA